MEKHNLAIGFILLLAIGLSENLLVAGNTATPIKHVVIIMQENHSFDNYFGTYPNANNTLVNGITSQLQKVNGLANGVCLPYGDGCISPYHPNGAHTTEPAEGKQVYENDYDDGKVDGFANNSGPQSMAYFDYHQIAAYWDYAEEYGLGDNYYASVLTTTSPNRLMLLSGGTPVSYNYGPPPYIPYSETVFNQLAAHGISWGYYDSLRPSDSAANLYPVNYISGLTPEALSHVQDLSAFFQALSKDQTLPSVSFVMTLAETRFDEHPPQNVTAGMLWAVSVVNAVMNSSYWYSSAIFITWDEGGGYYDHVPPPQNLTIDHGFDSQLHGYGQRVPLLVLSPYAKENYVSRTLLNHMSLLRFIDSNWNLRTLNENVANSNNLLDFFAYGQPPRPPLILGSSGPFSASDYPVPIQIPFDQLPYPRTGSWNQGETASARAVRPIEVATAIVGALVVFAVALKMRGRYRYARALSSR